MGEDRDGGQRGGGGVAEERGAGVERFEDDLGHAVVEFGPQGGELGGGQHHQGLGEGGVVDVEGELDHALDAAHGGEAAEVGDVGGLGRPRGDGARAGGDDLDEAGDGGQGAAGAVGEEFFQHGLAFGGQGGGVGGEFDQMGEPGGEGPDREAGGGEVGAKFFQAERREGGGAAEDQHGRENGGCFGSGRARSRGGTGWWHFGRRSGGFAQKSIDRRGLPPGMNRFLMP